MTYAARTEAAAAAAAWTLCNSAVYRTHWTRRLRAAWNAASVVYTQVDAESARRRSGYYFSQRRARVGRARTKLAKSHRCVHSHPHRTLFRDDDVSVLRLGIGTTRVVVSTSTRRPKSRSVSAGRAAKMLVSVLASVSKVRSRSRRPPLYFSERRR